MCPYQYYNIMRQCKDPKYIRYQMALAAIENGVKPAARRFHATIKTVRKWRDRWTKSKWKLFLQTDLDTKDLDDIPELWPQIKRRNLPVIQYTAREVSSGLQFIAYAQERSLACATLFAKMLIEHFRTCGVILNGCRFQTDNGSEFIGSWNAKNDSAFTEAVQSVEGLEHTTIPPSAHTWQADVETVHRLIEDEFYEVETFRSRRNFLNKAAAYNVWFNIGRKNTYKENQTPLEIVQKRDTSISPQIAYWTPVYLDEIYMKVYTKELYRKTKGGYDVVPHP